MATARGSNQRLTLLILVLVSVTVLTLEYHGAASRVVRQARNGVAQALNPVQRVANDVLHPVGDVFAGAIHYGQLEAQNAQLRERIGVLQRNRAEQSYALSAARQVDALSHLPFVSTPTVVGQVIAPATSNFENTIELDVGTSDGVGPGMPVVGPSGLVGQVLSASSNSSVVRLATDARFAVGVLLGPTFFRADGTGNGLTLEQLAQIQTPPHRGQVAITSGQDNGAFPPGIPVGQVNSVTRSSSGVVERVTISPAVNFSQLQYVAVLQWLSPA